MSNSSTFNNTFGIYKSSELCLDENQLPIHGCLTINSIGLKINPIGEKITFVSGDD